MYVNDGREVRWVTDTEEVKLKGYSKMRWFTHKENSEWVIREWCTGAEVGRGPTLDKAKRDARCYLGKFIKDFDWSWDAGVGVVKHHASTLPQRNI